MTSDRSPQENWSGWKWISQLGRRKTHARPPDLHALEGSGPLDSSPRPGRGRIICVASGKGGTGKSVIAANLAVYLARKGQRVVLFDADLGLANAHLVLGIYPRCNLSHVLLGHLDVECALEEGPAGVKLLSGGTGIAELASLPDNRIYQIASLIEVLEERYDYVVIDSAAGISPATMTFLYAASEVVVVTTSDITAMTDAYALLKTLLRDHPQSPTWVLANRTRRVNEGRQVYQRIRSVALKYLHHEPRFLGSIPDDPLVSASIACRRPLLLSNPRSAAARALLQAARQLHRKPHGKSLDHRPTDRPTDRILPLYRHASSGSP